MNQSAKMWFQLQSRYELCGQYNHGRAKLKKPFAYETSPNIRYISPICILKPPEFIFF